MNLSVIIPEKNVRQLAEQFLRSHTCKIDEGDSSIYFLYNLNYGYQLMVYVFNERRDSVLTKKECFDLMFEDINELELAIFKDGASTVKDSYPIDLLGSFSKDYLSVKDTSPVYDYIYTLDSIEYVIDYLCLIYNHNNNLLLAAN